MRRDFMMTEVDSTMSEITDNVNYLNFSNLVVGTEINCIAYVLFVELRVAKTEKGFAAFYLKDKNAILVVARLFNVEDYMSSGTVAKAFEGHPVKFKARVQEYGGSITLVIDGHVGIELYTGDFDYKKFIGSVDADLDFAAALYNKLFEGMQLPVDLYKSYSVRFLAQGRLGAFAKLVEMSFMGVSAVSELPGVDESLLLKTFFVVVTEYYNILLIDYQKGCTARITLFESYKSITHFCDENISYIVIDTLQAMLEGKTPQHLYANIIFTNILNAMKTLTLVYGALTIPEGSSSKIFFTDFLGNSARDGGIHLCKF